jgi:hypothetical protein
VVVTIQVAVLVVIVVVVCAYNAVVAKSLEISIFYVLMFNSTVVVVSAVVEGHHLVVFMVVTRYSGQHQVVIAVETVKFCQVGGEVVVDVGDVICCVL